MYDPAPITSQVSESRNPLARADALEREITDLCAQINARSWIILGDSLDYGTAIEGLLGKRQPGVIR